MNEDFLKIKLEKRAQTTSLRQLRNSEELLLSKIDFASNDYLGISRNSLLLKKYISSSAFQSGSTGSRLISGNHSQHRLAEKNIAKTHNTEDSLLFNSGYDANLGLLSCIADREDTILYDEFVHASIRDGIKLSLAKSYSFKHNSLTDLEKKIMQSQGNLFIVLESIYSMDGDEPPLKEIVAMANKVNAKIIIDEAHSIGWQGKGGLGFVQSLNLEKDIFARVVTFGKALGCHGAAILGSSLLKSYLVNYARSFIYTTSLSSEAVERILFAYKVFPSLQEEKNKLYALIKHFRKQTLKLEKINSPSPIQGILLPHNTQIKNLSEYLYSKGFFCLPMLYPTVAQGTERIRITLHSFNTIEEIDNLIAEVNKWKEKSY